MKLKEMVTPLICLMLLLYLSGCNSSTKSNKEPFNANATLEQLDTLLGQLQGIDSFDCKNLDEIVTINEDMRRIVENIRSIDEFDRLVEAYQAKEHQITFSFSEDKQIGVFSWHTKMDCLGHIIKNISLYKSNGKVIASSLYGKSLIFNSIGSIQKDNGNVVYLLNGGTTSEEPAIMGYTITNGYLVESTIPVAEKTYVNNLHN
ncbi:hypothetical protein [Flagellimonas profundi]|uniref:DUF4252 domain-containing protein n=1 Tax=Flagellimonas profundi TaxID=2915620 RepID=A0ABS3FET5_9FLAO|nr:hypothetical protein [Allomuricauda profundi]MBO0341096.1 hypothetical protein [Allomuricauda profundi]